MAAVRAKFQPELKQILAGPRSDPLWADALVLAASWKDPVALDAVRATVASTKSPTRGGSRLWARCVAVGDAAALDSVASDPCAAGEKLRGIAGRDARGARRLARSARGDHRA